MLTKESTHFEDCKDETFKDTLRNVFSLPGEAQFFIYQHLNQDPKLCDYPQNDNAHELAKKLSARCL